MVQWLRLHTFTAEGAGSRKLHSAAGGREYIYISDLYCIMVDLNISFSDQLEQLLNSVSLIDLIPY